jgi:hypothetical protein
VSSLAISSRPTRRQPFLYRLRALSRALARQETRNIQIFVQVGPVDVGAVCEDFEVIALLWRPMPKAGEPTERHRDRPPIYQIDR